MPVIIITSSKNHWIETCCLPCTILVFLLTPNTILHVLMMRIIYSSINPLLKPPSTLFILWLYNITYCPHCSDHISVLVTYLLLLKVLQKESTCVQHLCYLFQPSLGRLDPFSWGQFYWQSIFFSYPIGAAQRKMSDIPCPKQSDKLKKNFFCLLIVFFRSKLH